MGASANDYDLMLLDADLTTIYAISSNEQSGTQDPYEEVAFAAAGNEIVIVNNLGAAPRALHLNIIRGEFDPAVATDGQTSGHASARDAFSVAATNSQVVPFTGGPADPVEAFSSDGPRRVFYEADGTPITPGNFLFATNGGEVRQDPDITAADCVATATAGFNPFCGTSAAAPHAAAIAALMLDLDPTITPAQLRTALTSTALDNEAAGVDRDSGHGIIMAELALAFIPGNADMIAAWTKTQQGCRSGDTNCDARGKCNVTNQGLG